MYDTNKSRILRQSGFCETSGVYHQVQNPRQSDSRRLGVVLQFDLDVADKVIDHAWTVDAWGYAVTSIDRKNVKMHILLGRKNHDHVNRNRLDNRFENLRQCSQQENTRNCSIRSNNTSGFIGVFWNKQKNKWYAKIRIDKDEDKFLGYYNKKEDAIKARLKAESEFFGEFAPQRHLFEEYGIYDN